MTAIRELPFAESRPIALGRTANFIVSTAILLTFSQAWVFPILGDKGNAAASGLVRNLFFPAYGLGLILLATSFSQTFRAVLRQPFLIALMAIVTASILWSVAPDQTERRVIAILATTLCGVVIVAQRSWAELTSLLATTYAILVVLCFAFAILLPSIGIMHEIFPGAWRGVWSEKNHLGGDMALAVCIFASAAVLNPKQRGLWLVFAVLAIALILLSTSKTSLVAAALGLGGLVFVLLVQRGAILAVLVTWVTVVTVGSVVAFVLLAPEVFFDLLGKDATFTGRTNVWGPILRQVEQRPWTGFGYGAVWTEEGRWGPLPWIVKQAGFRAQHAHNAWLEQLLGMGIPGLAAFIMMQVQFLIASIVSAYRNNGGFLGLSFILCYTLMCVTESIAVNYNDFRWVLFTAIAVKLCWPDRESTVSD